MLRRMMPTVLPDLSSSLLHVLILPAQPSPPTPPPTRPQTIFGSLFITFFLLAGANYSANCKKAAGYVGFFCGTSAIYAAFAMLYKVGVGAVEARAGLLCDGAPAAHACWLYLGARRCTGRLHLCPACYGRVRSRSKCTCTFTS